MTAGASYGFFIAVPLPPAPPTPAPPPPTQSYREVVPLNFDGTTFTVPAITDCFNLPTPSPYTAPTSGPLTLSGSVSIAPTCAPASSSSSSGDALQRTHPADGGYSSPPPLYIVATVCAGSSSSSGGDSVRRIRSNDDDGGNNCSSSSSSSGDNVRGARPNDGGNGCWHGGGGWGGGGGGDSATHRARPSDDDGGGCINGTAIAGPVSVTSNPWVFAPISPALMLTAGLQYSFYVAMPSGGDGSEATPGIIADTRRSNHNERGPETPARALI